MSEFSKRMNKQERALAAARAELKQELEGLGFEGVSEAQSNSALDQVKSIFTNATWVSDNPRSDVPIVLPIEYSLAELFKDAGIIPGSKLQVVIKHLEVVAAIETIKADRPLFDDLAYRAIDLLIKDDSNTWVVAITHQDDLRVVKTSDSLVLPPAEKFKND